MTTRPGRPGEVEDLVLGELDRRQGAAAGAQPGHRALGQQVELTRPLAGQLRFHVDPAVA